MGTSSKYTHFTNGYLKQRKAFPNLSMMELCKYIMTRNIGFFSYKWNLTGKQLVRSHFSPKTENDPTVSGDRSMGPVPRIWSGFGGVLLGVGPLEGVDVVRAVPSPFTLSCTNTYKCRHIGVVITRV